MSPDQFYCSYPSWWQNFESLGTVVKFCIVLAYNAAQNMLVRVCYIFVCACFCSDEFTMRCGFGNAINTLRLKGNISVPGLGWETFYRAERDLWKLEDFNLWLSGWIGTCGYEPIRLQAEIAGVSTAKLAMNVRKYGLGQVENRLNSWIFL